MSATMFEHMLGATLVEVTGCTPRSECMVLKAEDGREFEFYHDQDCCEHVEIEDVTGDVRDLLGSPLLVAEEVSNMPEPEPGDEWDSHTWTFYRFVTMLGTVTVRWLGESNGYYSESVDFVMRPACGHTDCATSKDLARACGGR